MGNRKVVEPELVEAELPERLSPAGERLMDKVVGYLNSPERFALKAIFERGVQFGITRAKRFRRQDPIEAAQRIAEQEIDGGMQVIDHVLHELASDHLWLQRQISLIPDAKWTIRGYALAGQTRNGGPGQVRTGDLEVRNPLLYPSELQALVKRF